MRELKDISSVYFLGAGGIGMSALARFFNGRGIKVSGYDKTFTVLTKKLEEEGIAIHYEDDISLLDKEASIVVYTPAVPKTHSELNYYIDNNYEVVKRSDVLGMITKSSFNICVAGTHGKTTTSAMVAHILTQSGFGCNAFLGGIASNYETNFLESANNVSVAEADEYDRSFLKLTPDIAIITAMDADHLDIYGTEGNMQDAFIAFSGKIKEGGLLIIKKGLKRAAEFKAPEKLVYAFDDESADVFVTNIRMDHGSYFFDAHIKEEVIANVELNMGGLHNVENALAAITVARYLKINEEKIKAAVGSFKGVKRRFEYIVKTGNRIMIDDYAHHPEELRALINGAKALFPGKKCTVIFQPHLFSRTNDLTDGFAEVLSLADETILLPIYPARELPVLGVTSQLILNKMTNPDRSVKDKEALLDWLKKNDMELLITAGAGDIDTLVEPIKAIIINKER